MNPSHRKKRRASVRIRPDEAGTNLLDYLNRRFTYHTRSEWRGNIVAGRIRVNGKSTNSDRCLEANDTLDYWPPAKPEPKVDKDIAILHEDDDILVVNKPGNLPCHPSGRYFTHTLWYLLKQSEDIDQMRLINRLDRETSGIVLIAKNVKAERGCRRQFETGMVHKSYLVLVEGPFPDEPIHASGRLERVAHKQIRRKFEFTPMSSPSEPGGSGKLCETIFKVQKRFERISLVDAMPKTGRTHQIRATLSSLGYPVVGDKLYGVDETMYLRFMSEQLSNEDRSRLRMPRQALHAAELRLIHPLKQKPVSFDAPIPEDILKVIETA